MAETEMERIQQLEKSVRRLEDRTALKETPVLGFALFGAMILFVVLVANLPLSGDGGFWRRTLFGLVAWFAGGLLFMGALAVVRFGLKAFAEVLFVGVLLLNVSTAAVVWSTLAALERRFVSSGLQEALLDANISIAEETRIAVLLSAALALFLVDLAALVVIYPLARTAGTDLDLD